MPTMPAPGAGLPDENKGPQILGASATVTTIALMTVVARLVVRSRIVRRLGTDVSTCLLCTFCTLSIAIPTNEGHRTMRWPLPW
jgi:hypothetical protein